MHRVVPLLPAAGLFASGPAAAFEVARRTPDQGFDEVVIDVGGFVQPRVAVTQQDEVAGYGGELGFQVARARLEIQSALNVWHGTGEPKADRWGDRGYSMGWGIRPKLSAEMLPEALLTDAFLDVRLRPYAQLRTGQFKAPVNQTFLVSDRKTLFPERAELQDLSPGREMGAMVHGYAPEHRFEYNLAAFNGEGPNRLANVNRKLLMAWRVATSPLGGPGPRSELLPTTMAPTFTLAYAGYYNVDGPEGQEEATIGHNASGVVHAGPATVQGEFLWQFNDWQDPAIADFNAVAWYTQAGVFVPGTEDRFALLVRYEDVEPFDNASAFPVPLSGPTDPNQARQILSGGVGLYAGQPWFESVHELRVQVIYSLYLESEGQPFHNDQFQVAGHFTF